MALATLSLIPDANGYTYAEGQEVLSVQLAGGMPRMRLDVVGAWGVVDVQWTVGASDYEALRAFYAANKAIPFLAHLTIESNVPTLHRAMFVPGSFKLKALAGVTVFVQGAQLYVEPTVHSG